jgi:nucleotide-binding universal stress UspA family protein
MPRKLLEHGGSEAPDRERQLDTELKREQAEWLRQETAKESPVLHSARAKLCEAGVAADRIELRFESGDDIGECIVEQAKAGRYHAVALGHGGSHLRPGSVTRVVLNHAERLVVWLA